MVSTIDSSMLFSFISQSCFSMVSYFIFWKNLNCLLQKEFITLEFMYYVSRIIFWKMNIYKYLSPGLWLLFLMIIRLLSQSFSWRPWWWWGQVLFPASTLLLERLFLRQKHLLKVRISFHYIVISIGLNFS